MPQSELAESEGPWTTIAPKVEHGHVQLQLNGIFAGWLDRRYAETIVERLNDSAAALTESDRETGRPG